MSSRPVVVLVGPMGAGKTRVGKRVARLLDTEFSDTDRMVVAQHGPIADIFHEHGEPHFRNLERAAVAEALAGEGVVSLGGGAVLDARTLEDLRDHRVVFLTVQPRAVEGRLGGGKRPLIRNGLDDWQRIFDERRHLYDAVSDIVVDTSFRAYDEIAEEVAEWARTPA
ncbi:MAG: shikimate kinase [Schumannella sp.]|nr:shikimate kinase [Microbacteriaceae bacterium]